MKSTRELDCAAMRTALNEYTRGAEQSDDITILAFRFLRGQS